MQTHSDISDVQSARKSAHLRIRTVTHSQHEGTECKQSVLCANGLMEVFLDQPFKIVVSSFTNAPRRLHKHMKFARAEPPPDYYVPLVETVRIELPVDTEAAVQRDDLRFSKR